jgi:hypothetical protein
MAWSPDGAYLVFALRDPSEVRLSVARFYSYETATGHMMFLGEASLQYTASFLAWAYDRIFVLYTSDMPEWSLRLTYVADAAQPGSLKEATRSVRVLPEYYDDPPRLEVYNSPLNHGDGNAPYTCEWIIYYLDTGETETIDYGTLCPEYGPTRRAGYFRDVPFENVRDSSPTATLVYFDPLTGERRDLYTAEIEAIQWVTRDEHYAVLVLDSSGRVDSLPGFQQDLLGDPQRPTTNLIDLTTGETLYEMPTTWMYPLFALLGRFRIPKARSIVWGITCS